MSSVFIPPCSRKSSAALRGRGSRVALRGTRWTMPSELAGFGIPAFFLAAITYLLAADFSVSKSSASRVPTPLGCAQGYQPIFQVGGKVDASVSSLLETRAKAIGKAERQLTDDAFRRMGVYVYDHNCSWAARPPPFVEIEGGCTITAVEHCWHECHDTYNYTLTHSERFFGLAVESFTIEETITRTRGASCARNKGCAADGWEDGPPFGTWKLGDISRCWAPTPGEEDWLPRGLCGNADPCFMKTVDPYNEMQQMVDKGMGAFIDHLLWSHTHNALGTACSSISPQTCAYKTYGEPNVLHEIITFLTGAAVLLYLLVLCGAAVWLSLALCSYLHAIVGVFWFLGRITIVFF